MSVAPSHAARLLLAFTGLTSVPAVAQQMPMNMPGMDHGAHTHAPPSRASNPHKAPARSTAVRPTQASSSHGGFKSAVSGEAHDEHIVASEASPPPGAEQEPPGRDHEHSATPLEPAPTASTGQSMAAADDAMPGMDHGAMGHAVMPAMLGPYSMMREASGTSWQPDSSPMWAVTGRAGGWATMLQGSITLAQDHQGGPRGANKTFSQSMLMAMGNRDLGGGRLGLRAMVSLDPLMGKRGYPLLFATGETADGRTELVDRQHPHDFFMELAASWSRELGGGRAVYLYAGLPGEPALGPPAFMHRVSGMDNPEAPIGHHWFDSTHVTFGVVTAGVSSGPWKIEASAFKGREPDQHRWDVESPKLNSWSVRAFWNPTANLSLQASTGHLKSPEALHPESDEQRTTASATYNLPLGQEGNWATTVAWSLKDQRPGPKLHGLLAETALRFANRHAVFARAERVDEAELFASGPLHHDVIPVSKLSLGYSYELPLGNGPIRLALGGLASAYAYPDRIKPAYGGEGIKSFMLFARLRLADAMMMQ